MLMWLLVLVLQTAPTLQPTPTYHVAVIGGTGSGDYLCGQPATIVADKTQGETVFTQWHLGWDGEVEIVKGHVHHRRLTITAPCHRVVILEAKFMAKSPKRK